MVQKELLSLMNQVIPSHCSDIFAAMELVAGELFRAEKTLNNNYVKIAESGNYELARQIVCASEMLRNYSNQIKNFVEENQQARETEPEEIWIEETEAVQEETNDRIDYSAFAVDDTIEYDLFTPMTFKRPCAVKFKDKKQPVKEFKEMYLYVCSELYALDSEKFNSFVGDPEMRGRKIPWVTKDPDDIPIGGQKIGDTGLYLATNLDANDIRTRILKMLEKYNLVSDTVKVFFCRDYANLHTLRTPETEE